MGSDHHYPEETPARWVEVPNFKMDAGAVTNDDFAKFVLATGYVTTCERALDPAAHPDMPDEFYLPGSLVFQMTPRAVRLSDPSQWWSFIPGACWRHPEGPQSNLAARGLHPVVHVSYTDAQTYALWAGKKLPTQAQWEYAAQPAAGAMPADETNLNIWHGHFPYHNLRTDAAPFTVPSLSNAPSDKGMFNMLGNVWEWTRDPYNKISKADNACCSPETATSKRVERVLKGGSFLCAESYCRRYRPAARLAFEEDAAACHIGFRCISV